MYTDNSAGAICVIATDLPSYMSSLADQYPGELRIDAVRNHRGERAPSYRLEGKLDSRGNPVWINGVFLDFVRMQWDTVPAPALN